MKQFRYRPLPVEAVQWFEREHLERQGFKPGHGISDRPDPVTGVRFKFHSDPSVPPTPVVRFGKSDLPVHDGDWIVYERGRAVPMSPAAFEEGFEAV